MKQRSWALPVGTAFHVPTPRPEETWCLFSLTPNYGVIALPPFWVPPVPYLGVRALGKIALTGNSEPSPIILAEATLGSAEGMAGMT